MNIHQIEKYNQYVRYLSENSPEIDLLFKELLIGVTSFFREPDSFAVLKDKVISNLLKNKKGKETIRAWVVDAPQARRHIPRHRLQGVPG